MKQLIGHDIGTYVFNASAGTITFSDVTLTLDQILLITDATASTIIYVLGNTSLGGSMSDNVLTLDYNTSSLSNSDVLQIYVDVPASANPLTVSGTVSVSNTVPVNVQDGNGNIVTSTDSALDVNLKSSGATVAVSGTFWQATQPISVASLPLPSNAAQETGGNLATIAGAVSGGKVQVNITNSSISVSDSTAEG